MTLAVLWYVVLAVLWVGFLVLEGFDFGVGMLHRVVGRDEAGRQAAVRTIAPVWDGNEVWLITAVAATFAAFPAWYATMLSGFYPLFLIVLLGLILRGVSFEFHAHAETALSRRVWSSALVGGSLVVPLVLGIVLGGLLHGVPVDSQQEFVGGFGDLFSPYAVFTGVTITVLCLLHGAVFLAFRTVGEGHRRADRIARALAPVTAVIVTGFAFWTRIGSAHGVLLSLVELGAVLAAITAVALVRDGRHASAFAATSITIAMVVAVLFSELYPRVMVSTINPANDLTVAGTTSSSYALGVMTVVLVVLLPVILAYQAWTYHVFRGRIGSTGQPAVGGGPRPPSGAAGAASAAAEGVTVTVPPSDPEDPNRRVAPRAMVRERPPPLVRFATWLLAWIAALLILRARAALSTTAEAGRVRRG